MDDGITKPCCDPAASLFTLLGNWPAPDLHSPGRYGITGDGITDGRKENAS
jgi:hypothetical protein